MSYQDTSVCQVRVSHKCSLENVPSSFNLCPLTYMSAFGFVGFILYFQQSFAWNQATVQHVHFGWVFCPWCGSDSLKCKTGSSKFDFEPFQSFCFCSSAPVCNSIHSIDFNRQIAMVQNLHLALGLLTFGYAPIVSGSDSSCPLSLQRRKPVTGGGVLANLALKI